MKRTIRLTEADLHSLIENAVYNVLYENEEDEGLWNQVKQGAKSFFGNGYGKDEVDKNTGNLKNYRNSTQNRQEAGDWTANKLNGSTPMNLKGRWNAAKTGFQQQGNIDNANKIIQTLDNLEQLVGVSLGKYGVDPNKMTIGQLRSYLGRAKGTANRRVNNANNAIYKGMEDGVMGSGKYRTV